MRVHALIWLLALGAWTLSAAAVAQEREAPGEENGSGNGLFGMWDRDGDGRITEQELGDSDLFLRWDLDGDEGVTPSEFYKGLGNGLAPNVVNGQDNPSK
jgi:hypothetical protein